MTKNLDARSAVDNRPAYASFASAAAGRFPTTPKPRNSCTTQWGATNQIERMP
ncbi:hypothetical protein [Azospirillum ramasamyi]|uniref:hypothetical protein n=1 Tax=Azospirillum ramasamyi TaxID=682998 RepID=UPI0013A6EB4A|nr:hypothetical protein [Azospirillum ramasamyi]